MKRLTFWFDVVSPFAYLAFEQLPQALQGTSYEVEYRPILFAGLLNANAHKGPAEIPAKRTFTYRFVTWQAKRMGIPIKFPPEHPFNPLALLRLAIACDCRPEAVQRIFRFVWRDGRLPDLPIEWAELVHDVGLADANARIADPEVKAALRANTDEAISRGVFGVPTLELPPPPGGTAPRLFFGDDALDMAAACLRGDPWFETGWEAAANRPVAVQRPR